MALQLLKSLVLLLAAASQPMLSGAMMFSEDDGELQDETSFMQIGMSKPVPARRVSGRAHKLDEEEDEEEESAVFFQSSLKKTGVNERSEEFESDEFSM
mmetsp:Transcript_78029/g.137495  ORF Transcript_78029/g.137495 Transcript_78029/m.137495 type:complete len:99 (-) Transcript_78029:71-367(-)|eukprot:CAMPEP_0197620962 /NCGR_PEP_ID=MMETSP1338-20131121/1644_1 /TAXON_ID=43686 ORGANISM="Pelagodinium beii, Strain RCC1491" /NCGR_SAMPLE_ID=MMETSP1338 /ASSEMBLY_ACC=CAM_ASM_000754 /LENGTH=98 /DNA_ID=CAMNT_0043190279 /DNA_START=98 /DNA_END=394 /DNA_ORIENTATION=+